MEKGTVIICAAITALAVIAFVLGMRTVYVLEQNKGVSIINAVLEQNECLRYLPAECYRNAGYQGGFDPYQWKNDKWTISANLSAPPST